MIEMGFVVFIGLAIMYSRLGLRARLWINSHPLTMDVMTLVILSAIHWGTFSGLMVAAVGALFCSLFVTLMRKWFGFIEAGQYVRGWIDLGAK